MTRTLTSGMQTAIAADRAEVCYLFEFEFSGGTTRLTTAGADIVWNSQNWSSYAALTFGAAQETPLPEDQQVNIKIDACDTSVLAEILDEDYIGRLARIYLAHLDASGNVIADPVIIFEGYMNHTWDITENRPEDNTPGYATIETTLASRLVKYKKVRGIRMDKASHQNVGLDQPYSADTIMRHVPTTTHWEDIGWGKLTQ